MLFAILALSRENVSSQASRCYLGYHDGHRSQFEPVREGPGAQISVPLDCSRFTELYDAQSATSYEICGGACSHPNGWAPACHINCVRLVEGRIRECLQATAYTFEPTRAQQESRDRWLLDTLVSKWARMRPDPHGQILNLRILPVELRWKIAEHLLREYSTARVSALQPTEQTQTISISKAIWARFVAFEGITYVASLSNSRRDDKDQLIHTPTPQHADHDIYLCQDHLGILQVVFSHSEKPLTVSERRTAWWSSFRASTDCLKARMDVSPLATIELA